MSVTAADIDRWRGWIGRSERRVEMIAAEPLRRFAAVLGEDLDVERTMPSLGHWALFLPATPAWEIGEDGHPKRGGLLPPIDLPRRMFAGGRAVHLAPLRIGATAVRRTEVVSRAEKQGRSGPLTFVTVRHTFEQDGRVAVVDDQDIVYRPPASGRAPADSRIPSPTSLPPQPELAGPEAGLSLTVDPVVLFRFSALTFNAHRIHYDRPYAATEGYRDLLVHGPLQVLAMAECLRCAGVSLARQRFEYRLQAPAVGPQRLTAQRAAGDSGEDTVVLVGSVSGPVARAWVGAL